jgi:hypothetical protein
MNIAKLNLKYCAVAIDSQLIEIDENGVLLAFIEKLCSGPVHENYGRTLYHLSSKVSVCGKPADSVIKVEEGGTLSLTFLFDLIEFLKSSILESKVIKACEKSWNLKFTSDHPSTAFLESCEWGSAVFFYDAKQGDLSLKITFKYDHMGIAKVHDSHGMT